MGEAGIASTNTLAARIAARQVVPRDAADFRVQADERLAICLADGIPLAEAERTAETEIGMSLDELVAIEIADWRRCLSRLAIPADPRLAGLVPSALDALDEAWLTQAARLGWSDVELFGLHETAPLVREDAQGLVCGLALAPWPCRVIEVTAKHARWATESGALQTRPRGLTFASVVLWEHPVFADAALVGGLAA